MPKGTFTEEHKAKISAALKGHGFSPMMRPLWKPTQVVGLFGNQATGMSQDVADVSQAVAKRLNVGSGEVPLLGWVNLEPDPRYPADLRNTVPPIPFEDGALDEIYAGHFLEHLDREMAHAFLDECWRCLKPGGKLGLVVPDTREIVARYLAGTEDGIEYPVGTWHPVADMDEVCAAFLYSTIQPSRHQWSYDSTTLRRIIEQHGFRCTAEIDRWNDPRVLVGAWYQCGVDAVKEEKRGGN